MTFEENDAPATAIGEPSSSSGARVGETDFSFLNHLKPGVGLDYPTRASEIQKIRELEASEQRRNDPRRIVEREKALKDQIAGINRRFFSREQRHPQPSE